MRRFFWDKHLSTVELQWRRTLQQSLMLLSIAGVFLLSTQQCIAQKLYAPNHPFIQYTGRIDFSNPALPKYWQPGVYVHFKFKGPSCQVILKDEALWGKNHNYLELVIDGKAVRSQTQSESDTILLKGDVSKKIHDVVICKNTEANIGYLAFAGVRCRELVKPSPKPKRKIECIGNSITCGTGSDQSSIACGKGVWQDQHNAYMSYGAVTARALNTQYHLSSVSGIGLMHSCCNLNITMPQVFDKIDMRNDTLAWDFKNYQPDVVTVCLGQNDGIQDSSIFCSNYISFLQQLRSVYPTARFVLLTSPMANAQLRQFMSSSIKAVAAAMHAKGDDKVFTYVFEKQYSAGCDSHPSLEQHKEIAALLTAYLKKLMFW